MKREIKFRKWDGYKMEDAECILDGKATYWDIDSQEWFEDHGAVLMQYTGLKDKNGVEIYEGDILGRRPYGYLKSDGTKDGRYKGKEWECFAVEWGAYDASDLVSGFEYETDGKYVGWNLVIETSWHDDSDTTREIIGNIYENGDLLNVTTN